MKLDTPSSTQTKKSAEHLVYLLSEETVVKGTNRRVEAPSEGPVRAGSWASLEGRVDIEFGEPREKWTTGAVVMEGTAPACHMSPSGERVGKKL